MTEPLPNRPLPLEGPWSLPSSVSIQLSVCWRDQIVVRSPAPDPVELPDDDVAPSRYHLHNHLHLPVAETKCGGLVVSQRHLQPRQHAGSTGQKQASQVEIELQRPFNNSPFSATTYQYLSPITRVGEGIEAPGCPSPARAQTLCR